MKPRDDATHRALLVFQFLMEFAEILKGRDLICLCGHPASRLEVDPYPAGCDLRIDFRCGRCP